MTTHEDHVATAEAHPADRHHLHVLASQCGSGTCPTIYGTDRDAVVVQGYAVDGDDAGVTVPSGEHLVEIPIEVLLAAADKIRNQA